MRTWLLMNLLVGCLAAAGCTQGDDRDGDDFQGTCPYWIQSPSSSGYSNNGPFTNNATVGQPIKTANDTYGRLLEEDGRPLDIVSVSFYPENRPNGGQNFLYVQDGRLTARFSRANTGEPILAYDVADGPRGPSNPGKSEWVFLPRAEPYTNWTWQINLAEPHEPANPGPVQIEWEWQRDLDQNPETETHALIKYSVNYWYRV